MPEGTSQTTNSSGKTRFDSLSCEEHAWVINITGYVRVDVKKQVQKSSLTTVYVEKINQSAFETVVVDDKLKRDGSKRTLKSDQFQKAIGARGDPIVALENEPGSFWIWTRRWNYSSGSRSGRYTLLCQRT